MATSITQMAQELQSEVAWQRTPVELTMNDYEAMIINGIRRLYIDTARAPDYNTSLFSYDARLKQNVLNVDLPIDEYEYAMICAKINFFKRVASDVNNIVGYTTDALTVTNADKPYANLKDTIANLENERRITYYKMVRYIM